MAENIGTSNEREKTTVSEKSKDKIFFKSKKVILPIVLAVLMSGIAISTLIFISNHLNSTTPRLNTISTSSLQQVLEISELSTVNYTYNAVAVKSDEKGNVVYYVAYEGSVNAGIDFSKIEIAVFEEDKKVKISLPQVELQNCNVTMDTMEFIFVNSKYETENVTQEAYELCKQDLSDSISQDTVLFDMAKDNAIDSVDALFNPWIETLDSSYTLEIECEE